MAYFSACSKIVNMDGTAFHKITCHLYKTRKSLMGDINEGYALHLLVPPESQLLVFSCEVLKDEPISSTSMHQMSGLSLCTLNLFHPSSQCSVRNGP